MSEERLSQAIQLARRDLKKQRQQEMVDEMYAKYKPISSKKKQIKSVNNCESRTKSNVNVRMALMIMVEFVRYTILNIRFVF